MINRFAPERDRPEGARDCGDDEGHRPGLEGRDDQPAQVLIKAVAMVATAPGQVVKRVAVVAGVASSAKQPASPAASAIKVPAI